MMLFSLVSNKYGATIVVVLAVMAYCYIFKPASLFEADGSLKSKLITPEVIALLVGLCAYFVVEYLTRGSPQEVVVVGSRAPLDQVPDVASSSATAAAGPNIRRADALMSTPFRRRG